MQGPSLNRHVLAPHWPTASELPSTPYSSWFVLLQLTSSQFGRYALASLQSSARDHSSLDSGALLSPGDRGGGPSMIETCAPRGVVGDGLNVDVDGYRRLPRSMNVRGIGLRCRAGATARMRCRSVGSTGGGEGSLGVFGGVGSGRGGRDFSARGAGAGAAAGAGAGAAAGAGAGALGGGGAAGVVGGAGAVGITGARGDGGTCEGGRDS